MHVPRYAKDLYGDFYLPGDSLSNIGALKVSDEIQRLITPQSIIYSDMHLSKGALHTPIVGWRLGWLTSAMFLIGFSIVLFAVDWLMPIGVVLLFIDKSITLAYTWCPTVSFCFLL